MPINTHTANQFTTSFMRGFSFIDQINQRNMAQDKLDIRLEEERADRAFRRGRLEAVFVHVGGDAPLCDLGELPCKASGATVPAFPGRFLGGVSERSGYPLEVARLLQWVGRPADGDPVIDQCPDEGSIVPALLR